MVTAPQPLGLSGPMAQGHLMTIEIQGVDLILSQAPRVNMHLHSPLQMRDGDKSQLLV